MKVLGNGLCWKVAATGMSEEEAQVNEVQRLEGVRLGFEVLSKALNDRENVLHFNVGLPPLLLQRRMRTSLKALSGKWDTSPSFPFCIDYRLTLGTFTLQLLKLLESRFKTLLRPLHPPYRRHSLCGIVTNQTVISWPCSLRTSSPTTTPPSPSLVILLHHPIHWRTRFQTSENH